MVNALLFCYEEKFEIFKEGMKKDTVPGTQVVQLVNPGGSGRGVSSA